MHVSEERSARKWEAQASSVDEINQIIRDSKSTIEQLFPADARPVYSYSIFAECSSNWMPDLRQAAGIVPAPPDLLASRPRKGRNEPSDISALERFLNTSMVGTPCLFTIGLDGLTTRLGRMKISVQSLRCFIFIMRLHGCLAKHFHVDDLAGRDEKGFVWVVMRSKEFLEDTRLVRAIGRQWEILAEKEAASGDRVAEGGRHDDTSYAWSEGEESDIEGGDD